MSQKSKNYKTYSCQECGSISRKWAGVCKDCGTSNSIVEESNSVPSVFLQKTIISNNNTKIEYSTLDQDNDIPESVRIKSHNQELDRVHGGGFVPGSAILIGGEPGIGKSTLLIQTAELLARGGSRSITEPAEVRGVQGARGTEFRSVLGVHEDMSAGATSQSSSAVGLCKRSIEVLYISGEESAEQIKLRAKRLGISNPLIKIAAATSLGGIVESINKTNAGMVIIDSIQTIYHDGIESAPGTVSQVRACAFELIRVAKQRNIILILVGHVTKDGQIAGPKVLEHMVDTVLYFEGERGNQYRIIRAVKNRFGAANEIAVFEMSDKGLQEVKNPSAIFLSERNAKISGSCIFAGIEGTRPILLEVQALIVPTFLATPRRAAVGWDANRLAMMIAILNARYGLNLMDKEVYLNVTGGLKISEPAADLAVAAALISAATNKPVDEDMVLFGELGLSGEVRQVTQLDARLKEIEKLGFKRVVIPYTSQAVHSGLHVVKLRHIKNIAGIF